MKCSSDLHVCDRQFQRPNAAELSDFGCLIVLALGVVSLQRIGRNLFTFLALS